MKPIRLIHRISAAALALLMLASLPACKDPTANPSESESENTTAQQVTDTPETTAPSDGTESVATVTDSASADTANGGESSGALLWIIIGAVVLVAAGVAVFFVLKKKK